MPAKLKTPLRYPGGKAKLKNYIISLLGKNSLIGCTYIEAFAGGAGLAIELLFGGHVKKVILSDIDRSVFALWNSILHKTDELIELIESTEINLDEWYIQKKVQKEKESADLVTLGFSTLFLNRTNRSGILNAGPIGGKKQNGKYLLDCRFNKKDIISRIKEIAKRKNQIEFYNMDAVDFISFISEVAPSNSFIFFDPPYFEKGPELYTNYYDGDDHSELSNHISNLDLSWIITYDDSDYIKSLYDHFTQTTYHLSYSAQKQYKGIEVMIYSDNLEPVPIKKAH